jgi:endonuclease YncB( thermonuclease family)
MKTILLLLFVSGSGLNYKFTPHKHPAKREIRLLATRIIDGDTFEGRANDSTFRIRLNGIDAPERGQDFYNVSKQRLGELCKDSPLLVTLFNKDRYGRWIADVHSRNNIFINYKLVEEGLAWHFKKYSSDTLLAALENNARAKRSGLWVNNNPVAPWVKRK